MDILIEEFQGKVWAAAIRSGRLEGLEVDPPHEAVRWGAVYRAKITRIDKSLDAAFLDLDGVNTGMLYNRDVMVSDKNGTYAKGGDKEIGKTLKAGDIITVQAKSAYLSADDEMFQQTEEDKIVQTSMNISIPGRYLIYTPLNDKNQVSRRIRGKDRRKKLENMLAQVEGMSGLILRSAGADLQTDILVREAKILKDTWQIIAQTLDGTTSELLIQGPNSIQRMLSDMAMESIDTIKIVTLDHYQQAEDWCNIFAPDLVTKIVPVELDDGSEDLALFEHEDMMGQIETLFYNYVLLPSGGNLIIQSTAALTAVDINKGGDKRSHLALNLEAVKELARQMRLRNCGGIIVVDFLKMTGKKDKDALLEALDNATYSDPCTVQIHGMTNLGLVEITRKRRTPALAERFEGIEF